MRDWISIGLLMVAFALVASLMNSVTPYRREGMLKLQRDQYGNPLKVPDVGAPDERQHANYVKHVLSGQGVPILRPGAADLYETYQSHQPPLYYFVAAGWCQMLGIDPTDPSAGGKLRALNILVGLGTLAALVLVGLWGFGRLSDGLAGAALIGLMPMHVALCSAVSNDPLLFMLLAFSVAGVGHAIRYGWTLPKAVSIGVLVGMALWTKSSGLAMLAALVVPAAFRWGQSDRAWIRWIPVLTGIVVIAPWWIRNTGIYGDPLAMAAFQNAFVGSAQRSDLVAGLIAMHGGNVLSAEYEYWTKWFGWWTFRSFFGAFGQMDIFYEPVWYALSAMGILVLAYGWARGISRDEDSARKQFSGFTIAFGFVVILLFLQFNLRYFQAQARYLYPAIGSLGGILGYGATTLFKDYRHQFWPVLFLMILANMASLQFIQTQFNFRLTP